jgi:hypothetical protein
VALTATVEEAILGRYVCNDSYFRSCAADRFVATLVLGAGTLSLLLLTLGAAPRSTAARVACQLADRRREVSLLGGVMLMGVAVGYLTAVFAG